MSILKGNEQHEINLMEQTMQRNAKQQMPTPNESIVSELHALAVHRGTGWGVIERAADAIEALQRQLDEAKATTAGYANDMQQYNKTIDQLRSDLSAREAEVVALREAVILGHADLCKMKTVWYDDSDAARRFLDAVDRTAPTAEAVRDKWLEDAACAVEQMFTGGGHPEMNAILSAAERVRSLKGRP